MLNAHTTSIANFPSHRHDSNFNIVAPMKEALWHPTRTATT